MHNNNNIIKIYLTSISNRYNTIRETYQPRGQSTEQGHKYIF